jgi:integrase
MPRRDLTDRFCAAAKPAEGDRQTDYFDKRKGLALRVSDTAKGWTYLFTWGGKRVRMSLGTYPATSLARAHTLADEARAALEAGKDPREALAKPETFKVICEEWASREADALRTGAERTAVLKRAVYPILGDRPINEIRRSEIVRLLDRIEDERGPVAADRALAVIRRVFNWYASRSDDFRSPIVRGMARTKPGERARSRVLTDDELRVIWKTAEGQGAFGRLVRFLLLTGARRTEAAAMPWSELDGTEWLLPGARNKTKLELLRPLPAAALAVLGPKPDGAKFVFPSDKGGALCGYGALKEDFDKAVLAELRKANTDAEAMPRWVLHDLRRTCRSLLSRAGIPSDYAERCLGHVIGGVRGVYDRHEYSDEKADAYVKLARLIDRIVQGKPTLVRLVRRDATGSDANAAR